MGLGPIVLDEDHKGRLIEALSSLESAMKRGAELTSCLDEIDDEVTRYDLLELLFRAQDMLRREEPDWMLAAAVVRERMLDVQV